MTMVIFRDIPQERFVFVVESNYYSFPHNYSYVQCFWRGILFDITTYDEFLTGASSEFFYKWLILLHRGREVHSE